MDAVLLRGIRNIPSLISLYKGTSGGYPPSALATFFGGTHERLFKDRTRSVCSVNSCHCLRWVRERHTSLLKARVSSAARCKFFKRARDTLSVASTRYRQSRSLSMRRLGTKDRTVEVLRGDVEGHPEDLRSNRTNLLSVFGLSSFLWIYSQRVLSKDHGEVGF